MRTIPEAEEPTEPATGTTRARVAAALATLLLLGGLTVPAEAQVGSLTGRVTDERTGEPLSGVSIVLEELQRGDVTNVDGRFRLENLPPGTYTLRASRPGFTTDTTPVSLTAGENERNLELVQDLIALDAIVVTGQQIERQAREIPYSVSTIVGDEITRARETNFVSSLAGRVPGLEVTPQSGDVGGSTRIVIRGLSSLSGNNQPLFVVDGVPISNANIVAGTSQDRLAGAIDVGNRGADVNPDDIETITILRGAAAAALYGQRAKDGVILITTRRGTGIGGQTVTVNSSLRFTTPLVLPSFQNEYAQGSVGVYESTVLNGWGPRIAGQEVQNIRGETIQLRPYQNNVRDFYETGVLSINSFSFSAADERADFRLGVTHQDQTGILPNSHQGRTTVSLNSGYTLLPTFRARMSGVYTATGSRGRAVAGGNDPNVLTALVNSLPRTFDIDDLRDYRDEDGNQRALSTLENNPFWIANENVFSNEVERVFGTGYLEYEPVPWVTLTARSGIDFYTENRQNVNAPGTIGRADGLFSLDVLQERQVNVDFLAEAGTQLTDRIGLRGVVGFNAHRTERRIQRNVASELTVPGLLNFANATSNAPSNNFVERRLYGVFGDVTLAYDSYLFINATGRNDWSSTLPPRNNSFFYPSLNASFVFTDAFQAVPEVLAYGKLRASYARVGSDEAPYQLDFRYFPVSEIFGQYGTDNSFPYGGRTAFNATNVIPPANLRPQNQVSHEIGTELQFFQGRAGIDFTYYDVRTKDQIISIPIPQSTGFGFNRTNVGEISNKGIEAQVNLNPIRTTAWSWDAFLNYTRNRNEVVSLAPDLTEIVIAGAFSSLEVKAEPGTSLGIYGPGWLRDEDTGLPIIDPATGLRQEGDVVRLGDIDPDFRMSVSNMVSFSRVRVSFLLDWRHGGHLYSQTVGQLRRSGLAEETRLNREGTFIDEGVLLEADGSTRPNDVPVQNMQAFWQRYASGSIHEGNVFEATNVRLREVRLDYAVPRDWLARTPVSSVTIGLEARNLFLIYKKVPHIDPEVGLFGSASNGQGIEWNVLPSARSFGTNVQLRF